VNALKKIGIVSLAVVYLFLSTGVTLYKTFCECVGHESISLFQESETCNELIPDHNCSATHEHCDQCSTGDTHHSCDCGCGSPTISFLKLTDHFGEDSDIQFTLSAQQNLFLSAEIQIINQTPRIELPVVYNDYSPPCHQLSGRDLINYLNQRKIALLS